MSESGGGVIAVLSRAPEPGRVKTRMQPVLDAGQCARLHAAMTRVVLRNACAVPEARTELWVDGEPGDFAALADEFACELLPQPDGDLGARMSHIARRGIDAGLHIVLLGADCPLLGSDALRAVFVHLSAGAEAVMVPALDGGYVALGLRHFDARLFHNKVWGSDSVAAATRTDFEQLGWRSVVTAPVADIDRPEDLARLAEIPELQAFARR